MSGPQNRISVFLFFTLIALQCQGQDHGAETSDSIPLKSIQSKLVRFAELTHKDTLTLVCFWSSNNDESIAQLNAINGVFEKWKRFISFHLLAICEDMGVEAGRMRPTVIMNDWKFEVYSDFTGQLRQALEASSIPEALIMRKGHVLYRQSGYQVSSEKFLMEKMLHLSQGEG